MDFLCFLMSLEALSVFFLSSARSFLYSLLCSLSRLWPTCKQSFIINQLFNQSISSFLLLCSLSNQYTIIYQSINLSISQSAIFIPLNISLILYNRERVRIRKPFMPIYSWQVRYMSIKRSYLFY